jgi:hypothetical protein
MLDFRVREVGGGGVPVARVVRVRERVWELKLD